MSNDVEPLSPLDRTTGVVSNICILIRVSEHLNSSSIFGTYPTQIPYPVSCEIIMSSAFTSYGTEIVPNSDNQSYKFASGFAKGPYLGSEFFVTTLTRSWSPSPALEDYDSPILAPTNLV